MRWLICVLCVFISCTAAFAASDSPVGTIKTVTGTASVVRAQNILPAKTGDRIFEGDILRTGKDGSLGTVLEDETSLSLGPNSEIIISEFAFAPAKGKLAIVTRMVKGTAAYISGVIGKMSPQSVRFETPSASVGVRGTRFLVQVEDE
jgi:hypothetical protein